MTPTRTRPGRLASEHQPAYEAIVQRALDQVLRAFYDLDPPIVPLHLLASRSEASRCKWVFGGLSD